MRPEVIWFAHKCVEDGILTTQQCRSLKRELGDDVFLVPFGKTLAKQGICTDLQYIKATATEAWQQMESGAAPPSNPFEQTVQASARANDATDPVASEPEAKMPADMVWFALLGIDAKLFDTAYCAKLAKLLGEDVTLDHFTEILFDYGIAPSRDALDKLATEAKAKAKAASKPPPYNPFLGQAEAPPAPPPPAAPKSTPAAAPVEAKSAAKPSVPPPAEPTEEQLADDAAAAALRQLEEQPVERKKPALKLPPRQQSRDGGDSGDGGFSSDASASDLMAAAEAATKAALAAQESAKQAQEASGSTAATAKAGRPKGSEIKSEWLTSVPEGMPTFQNILQMDGDTLRQTVIQALVHCQRSGISDLHFSSDSPVFYRKNHQLEFIGDQRLDAEEAMRLNTVLLSDEQLKFWQEDKDLDFALALDEANRFRVNLMYHKDGPAGTYRIIPNKIQTLRELGYEAHEEVLQKMLSYHNGLILVTGPLGAGKTTTLASMIQELNNAREDHIIYVEEPIEIVQRSNKCSITQREVGPHTRTFHSALKGALRQDPDIIVIGEMRDLETIEMAISASETGHLVIGTMHTANAATTLNRLLDVFPPAQQGQIRAMVSESLRGIVCQRLLPAVDGSIVLAYEILVNNLAVASLIREGKNEGLGNVMETGKREGMVAMDTSVYKLYNDGKISQEAALAVIQNRILKKQITGETGADTGADDSGDGDKKKKKWF